MRYLLVCIASLAYGMHRETMQNPPFHVETVTHVLRESTTFVDSDDNHLVADSRAVVEVIIKIHRSGRPTKTITLNVDV